MNGNRYVFDISIHAPAKGATKRPTMLMTQLRFQSTHPRRVRPALVNALREAFPISIHAPAKGATIERADKMNKKYISIHAPAKGATENLGSTPEVIILFQSTHPRRVRRVRG